MKSFIRIFLGWLLLSWASIAAATLTPTLESQTLTISGADVPLINPNGEAWVEKDVSGIPTFVVFHDVQQFFTLTASQSLSIPLATLGPASVRKSGGVGIGTGTLTQNYLSSIATLCGNTTMRAPFITPNGNLVMVVFQSAALLSSTPWEVGCDLYWGDNQSCGGPTCEIRWFSPGNLLVSAPGKCWADSPPSGYYLLDFFITCSCSKTPPPWVPTFPGTGNPGDIDTDPERERWE